MASPNQLSSSVQEDGEANFEHDEAISQLEGEPTRRHSAVRIRHPPKTLPNFIYEPLSFPTSIRILELLPGNKQDYIQCRLYETTFDQKPQYEALSYIWGDSADKSQIVCCDGVIDIPSNLRDLLRRIRHPSETRHLWADAICINQSDKKEVGHQVGQMSSIYTVAERVIIWLGFEDPFESFDHDEDMSTLLRHYFKRLLERSASISSSLNTASSEDNDMHNLWTSFGRLLRKPWFRRLWVVQEAGLARAAVALFGDRELNFDTLLKVVVYIWRLDKIFTLTYNVTLPVCFYVFSSRHKAREYYFFRNPDFLDMLETTRLQIASDPRDYVFALLGHPSAQAGGELIIEPNYQKTHLEIFRELAITLLQKSRDLRVFSAVRHSDQSLTDNECPSWVPTWTRDVPTASKSVYSDIYMESDAHAGFPKRMRVMDSERVLQVHGFVFDTITECTEEFKDPEHRPAGETLFKIWPVAAAMELGMRSKGSTHDVIQDVGMALVGGSTYGLKQCLKDFAAMRLELLAMNPEQTREGPGTLFPEGLSAVQEAAKGGNATSYMSWDDWMVRKKLFVTEGGLIGSGSAVLQPGDLCCILFGGWIPFLLRLTGSAYRLVGESYIPRVMQGEAVVDYMLGDNIRDQMFDII